MTDKKEHIRHSMKSTAPADCVTEIRIGNSVLVVSGFFKQGAKAVSYTHLDVYKRQIRENIV